jgi:hypothetical protein
VVAVAHFDHANEWDRILLFELTASAGQLVLVCDFAKR